MTQIQNRFGIRAAEPSDVPILTGFILMEALEAEGRNLAKEIVERGVRAAVEEGTVAGYWVLFDKHSSSVIGSTSVYVEWSDWFAAPYWWIQSFYLAPEVRGLGLAEFLLLFLEERARAANAIELRLYVHLSNVRAFKAYSRFGFEDRLYDMLCKSL